jgi:glyoxylase-like metal-dependent hydrolase (beta-lactamase superfamily II)
MRRTLSLLAIGACANALVGLSASAQTAPEVALTRFDCGNAAAPTDVSGRFSDTFAYKELKLQLTYSCYLVRHGDEYMVWDAGFAVGANPNAPKVSMVDQLAQLKLTPDNIKYIGISHYHGDHIGQVGLFPKSTLLIGKGDWDALNAAAKIPPGTVTVASVNPGPFTHWISGGGKVEPVTLDKDVFGDGTVVVLDTPGHTPGHHSLLVRLKEMGPVLLTGDLAHFQENYDGNGVPTFNTDRAATLASLDRFKKIAANLKATVIIQHDPRDVGKLPVFPAAAK